MALPTSCVYQGKEVPLYTFKQLEQQARKTLGNRAKDLRDLVGAHKLPPLRPAAQFEEVTSWIIETQCAIARSAGLAELTPEALGMPASYGFQDDEMLNPVQQKTHSVFGASAPREPMADLIQGPTAGQIAAYEAAQVAAAATRAKNMRGNNVRQPDQSRDLSDFARPACIPNLSSTLANPDVTGLTLRSTDLRLACATA
jgi:hypothetical protein